MLYNDSIWKHYLPSGQGIKDLSEQKLLKSWDGSQLCGCGENVQQSIVCKFGERKKRGMGKNVQFNKWKSDSPDRVMAEEEGCGRPAYQYHYHPLRQHRHNVAMPATRGTYRTSAVLQGVKQVCIQACPQTGTEPRPLAWQASEPQVCPV